MVAKMWLKRPEGSETIEDFEVEDLLASLMEKCLVAQADDGRFFLLETVRNYSRNLLTDSGEFDHIRERHLTFSENLVEEAEPCLQGSEQAEWLRKLELEHDNLRAALDFAADLPAFAANGLAIAGNLGRFWMVRGHVAEGRRRYAELLTKCDGDPPSLALAKGLHSAGNMAFVQADYADARRLFESAAEMRREIGDRAGEAGSRCNVATLDQYEGRMDDARAQFERSLAIFEELDETNGMEVALGCLSSVCQAQGDTVAARSYLDRAIALNRKKGNKVAEAISLNTLGCALNEAGQRAEARAAFEEALAINRSLGNEWQIAVNLINLGIASRREGDLDSTESALAEAIGILQRVGDRRIMLNCLEELALLAAARCQPARAAHLLSAVSSLYEKMSVVRPNGERLEWEAAVSRLKSELGDARFIEMDSLGKEMTLEGAIAIALERCDESVT